MVLSRTHIHRSRLGKGDAFSTVKAKVQHKRDDPEAHLGKTGLVVLWDIL